MDIIHVAVYQMKSLLVNYEADTMTAKSVCWTGQYVNIIGHIVVFKCAVMVGWT